MRISDCSSDVCSSDLLDRRIAVVADRQHVATGVERETCTRFHIADDCCAAHRQIVAEDRIAKAEVVAQEQIGRATCRERVGKDVKISVGAVTFKNKKQSVQLTSLTYNT